MSEKTLGYVLVLCFVVLGLVWTFDVSNMTRYGISGLIVIGIAFWTFSMLRAKSKLKEFRISQAAAYDNRN